MHLSNVSGYTNISNYDVFGVTYFFAFINLLFLLSVSIMVKLLKMYVKLVPASSQAAFSTGQWASLWTPRDQKSEPDSLKG